MCRLININGVLLWCAWWRIRRRRRDALDFER
jgi:hypothetical protein